MGLRENHHMKLEMELKSAYRERDLIETGDLWQAETMRRIRLIGPHSVRAGYLLGLEQLLWRFAPIACVMIFICCAGLLSLDLTRGFEMARLFLDDPIEYVVAQSFGI
jgi:hypothetical protein